jgi:archaellum component FlaC
MPTMAPPDGETKQRFARVDERFDEVNRRITEGREETNNRFDRVEGDIRELKKSVAGIQESVVAIHATLTRISFGLALTFASVIFTKAF